MIYKFADWELDTRLYELRCRDKVVPLEPQVFNLLAYLVANHDRLVTKDELIGHIWPDRYISEASLNSRLMAARKAIGDSGKDQKFLRTVHARGYRFVGNVESSDPAFRSEERGQGTEGEGKDRWLRVADPERDQQIRFCITRDGVRLAYATLGEGPPLVKAANWLSHLEFDRRSPVWRHWLDELSLTHQLVRYDERRCGLSDWETKVFSFESWVDDLETVVDALGIEKFPLLGLSQGGPVAISYALRHPERVTKLVLCGSFAKGWAKRGLAQGEIEERRALMTLTRQGWGKDSPAYRQIFASQFIPGATPEQSQWFAELCRVSASPENAVRFMEEFGAIDIEAVLPQLRVPTLVMHARRDQRIPFEAGRRLAAHIPGARFVPLESANHILLDFEPAWKQFCHELRLFLT